jgi:nucleoside-diphosphate-sugar epimerase
LGDGELVTWADLYRPIATALGYDLDQLPEAEAPDFRPGWRQRLQAVHQARPTQMFLSLFPRALRQAGYDALTGLMAKPASPWALPAPPQPVVTEEMALLYRCQYKVPFDKARERLGYEPIVSFAEGCRRTIGWLRFAGYPLVRQEWQLPIVHRPSSIVNF